VLSITLLREAIDEVKRYSRDKEINSTLYKKLLPGGGSVHVKSSDIKASFQSVCTIHYGRGDTCDKI